MRELSLQGHQRLLAEDGGKPATAPFRAHNPDPLEPVAVLADVLARDDAQSMPGTSPRGF